MNNQRVLSLAFSVTLCMLATAALALLPGMSSYAAGTPRYVATTHEDNDECTNPDYPCRTVQYAVDVANPGDVIKVAEGVYDDVHDYYGSFQVVYIDKTVTIRGGYTTAFTDPPDPEANPTTLDARGEGHVVHIGGSGTISPTLEGLQLTNGAQVGDGGGVYAHWAQPTISGCRIYSNTATNGGGLLFASSDNVRLTGNTIYSNTAGGNGGGVFFWDSDSATMVNNVVVGNELTSLYGTGSGINAWRSTILSAHTTLARNSGGSDLGIYLVNGSVLTAVNTILVSHTVGIYVNVPATATLTATLWGNETDWQAYGTLITGTRNYWGNPAFAEPGVGDYHLRLGSAAVDRGVDAGVAGDIDGDPRPDWCFPDLGADELLTGNPCHRVYLPILLRNSSPP